MDIFADSELRLRALVALFAGVAGIRLMLAGLLQSNRRPSLIVGGILFSLILARELPEFLGRASPTSFRDSLTGRSAPPIARERDNPTDVPGRLRVTPAGDRDAVVAPLSDRASGDQGDSEGAPNGEREPKPE
jgi:hypothetical protein